MFEKEEEISNNVGVTIDILEVAEIHRQRQLTPHLYFLSSLHTPIPIMESAQIITLIGKIQFW